MKTKILLRQMMVSAGVVISLVACNGGSSSTNTMATPTIIISDIDGADPATMMASHPVTFKATISGSNGESSIVTAILANPALGVVTSNPSPCLVTVAGSANSCTFTVYTSWSTGFDNSDVNVINHNPFLLADTIINLFASNNIPIQGGGVTNNAIQYNVATPYIYLPAPIAGATTESNTGITWGSGGEITTRFIAGTSIESDCLIDKLTGLMWPKNGNIGFKDPTTGELLPQPVYDNGDLSSNISGSAEIAESAIGNMNVAPFKLCGHNDWHLPTVNELASLVNYAEYSTNSGGSPAYWLTQQGFSQFNERYWTETIYSTTNDHWNIEFFEFIIGDEEIPNIGINFAGNPQFVIPVRNSNNIELINGANIAYVPKVGPGNTQAAGTGKEWPTTRFVVDKDCITDKLTGLVWVNNKAVLDQKGSWGDASESDTMQYLIAQMNSNSNATGYKLCGYTDWRLPNVNELRSLVNYSVMKPGVTLYDWLDEQGFLVYGSTFASSTNIYSSFTATKWFMGVDFNTGITSFEPVQDGASVRHSYAFLPVRGGKNIAD